jgi:hypothetical protein
MANRVFADSRTIPHYLVVGLAAQFTESADYGFADKFGHFFADDILAYLQRIKDEIYSVRSKRRLKY